MDGRVKTLHPRLYAGLLALRDNPEHMAQAAEHDIEFVDLVCVNLYPFERTVARAGVTDAEAIENIDIGGPTMIRAAAKNYAFAAVVTSPESYDAVLEELDEHRRHALAGDARVARRRGVLLHRALRHRDRPLVLRAPRRLPGPVRARLREGDGPARTARTRTSAPRTTPQVGARTHVLSLVRQLHGKELSFNNLLDLDGARSRPGRVRRRAAGLRRSSSTTTRAAPRSATTASTAYRKAFAGDPRQRVRRHHRAQPPVDLELAAGARRSSSSRCSSPPATTTTRSRCSPRSRTCASSRTRSAAASATPTSTSARSTAACSCRTATSSSPTAPQMRGRHRAAADRGRVARPALRLARLPAREVQRDRASPRTWRRSASAPAR